MLIPSTIRALGCKRVVKVQPFRPQRQPLQQRICKLRQESAVAVISRIISVQAVLRGLRFARQPLCRIQKRCTASAAALVSSPVHPGKKMGREHAAHDALPVILGGRARGVVLHELICPVVCGNGAPPLAKGDPPLPVHFSVPISAPLAPPLSAPYLTVRIAPPTKRAGRAAMTRKFRLPHCRTAPSGSCHQIRLLPAGLVKTSPIPRLDCHTAASTCF